MRISNKYWAISAALIAANILIYATHWGGSEVLSWTTGLLPVLCGFLAVIGLTGAVGALKVWDGTKAAWLLLDLGIGLSTAAEAVYLVMSTILGINVDEIVPSLADCFWMAGYPFSLASLVMLLNGYRLSGFPMGSVKKYIGGIVAAIGVAVAVAVWVMVPILQDPETGWITKAVYLYYPVFDFVLIIPAAVLAVVTMQFGKGAVSLPWKAIALGFLCWGVSDILYSIFSWQGLYGDGNFIDLGWNASYLLIGAAGLYQRSLLRSK